MQPLSPRKRGVALTSGPHSADRRNRVTDTDRRRSVEGRDHRGVVFVGKLRPLAVLQCVQDLRLQNGKCVASLYRSRPCKRVNDASDGNNTQTQNLESGSKQSQANNFIRRSLQLTVYCFKQFCAFSNEIRRNLESKAKSLLNCSLKS
ncbi:hypothetical protein NDU88_005597 [Pleurodeles waltl]|uniref:Uncharacterized protein n=1 Tax=Pleurodeles waltl TaxID=8319 RepID=A0AAV7PJ01_PLEWA|nr:hypothetical protein NDU88_005597 [Pleurodeles waltl]